MANRYSSTVLISVFIFSLILLPTIVKANEVYVRNETLGILYEGIKLIKNASRPHESRVIDKIKIAVPIDPAPVRVRAFMESGNRIIELSTGYSAITRMIVSGYLIEEQLKINGFGEKYARYTSSTYATGRLGGGKPPWVKAKLSKSEQNKLLSSPKFNNEQQGAHLLVLWYVLAHEVAHHVLNHTYDDGVPLSKIREQEKEADDWANRIFMKMGLPPASAFPSHMYWYYLDEYGVTSEYRRSHPPELKRIRSALQLTINRFDDWNDNERLIPKLPKEITIKKYKRLLFYVEDLVSKQSRFDSDKVSTATFKQCMKIMYEGCLKSCQKKYDNPLSLCKQKLCNSDRSTRIWTLRCDDIPG